MDTLPQTQFDRDHLMMTRCVLMRTTSKRRPCLPVCPDCCAGAQTVQWEFKFMAEDRVWLRIRLRVLLTQILPSHCDKVSSQVSSQVSSHASSQVSSPSRIFRGQAHRPVLSEERTHLVSYQISFINSVFVPISIDTRFTSIYPIYPI